MDSQEGVKEWLVPDGETNSAEEGSVDSVHDNDVMDKEEMNKIQNTIIVTEKMSDLNTRKAYSINGSIVFDVKIDTHKDVQVSISGKIYSNHLLGNTKVYQLDTWRFCINNVSIYNIHCDSSMDRLEYDFIAKSFEVKA